MGYETTLYVGEIYGDSTSPERDYYTPHEGDDYPLLRVDIKGKETPIIDQYFSMIAMFELCKCGYDSHIYKLEHEKGHRDPEHINGYPSVCGFYGKIDDSRNKHIDAEIDTKVNTDCYGNVMTPVPIEDVIEALQKDLEEDDGYWRFHFTLDSLKSIKEHSQGSQNIYVLFYGH